MLKLIALIKRFLFWRHIQWTNAHSIIPYKSVCYSFLYSHNLKKKKTYNLIFALRLGCCWGWGLNPVVYSGFTLDFVLRSHIRCWEQQEKLKFQMKIDHVSVMASQLSSVLFLQLMQLNLKKKIGLLQIVLRGNEIALHLSIDSSQTYSKDQTYKAHSLTSIFFIFQFGKYDY